ncbi:hypothetical protein M409DRAFT_67319 [Zasmidium cellare ATCC 36951]|uniref:NmrA-like domain-containing protein n=1 Tax=Zasmidium cellare ATCC 36951 TaxID=1080233 RepID=A0A6A6CHU5_ZASCE|nr:uncharacterized protein M409DRAFT_67319 [Zasmidium cellare ATCC 36951]KAF2165522.1 hypothetical protein M409DRAFT_67319 [Zasmidium cellare ATCC 36951]
MANTNYIRKVAVVGAGGNVGRFITQALLKTGQHIVTAITRADSQSSLPEGVIPKRVDYEKPETLVEALKGQDALVITVSGRSPIQSIEEKLVRAAGEAGVPWILPNEWSPDSANQGLIDDVFLFGMKVATRKLIEDLRKSSYVAVATGFWYEYSLGIANNYGFDFAKRAVKFYDDGSTKISTSTWPQVGRAVAALISLPVHSDIEPCLERYKNQLVYINSFTVSQQDMLESALRVTSTKETDWTVTKEDSRQLYEQGIKEMKEGKFGGANFLYSRVFFPNGGGDFESTKGTLNRVLGLLKENLDEATKRAIERQVQA